MAAILRIVAFILVSWLVSQVLRRVLTRMGPRTRRDGSWGNSSQGGSSAPGDGASNGRHSPVSRSPYEVLEVAPEATAEEIRAAYRKKVQQYHPDKVVEMGPEIRQVAEQRMKEINAAYEDLKRRHGG